VRLFPGFTKLIDLTVPAAAEYLQQINEQIEKAVAITKDNRLTAKILQTKYANRDRRAELEYKISDIVMLNSKNIR
jgi:hypothetical protein